MSEPRDPNVLMYTGERDVITEIITREGYPRTGDDARIYNANEFSRVMAESGLNRAETVSDYGRTTAYPSNVSPGRTGGTHQAESASEAVLALNALGLHDMPFSAGTSYALLNRPIPDILPADFRDDGPATV